MKITIEADLPHEKEEEFKTIVYDQVVQLSLVGVNAVQGHVHRNVVDLYNWIELCGLLRMAELGIQDYVRKSSAQSVRPMASQRDEQSDPERLEADSDLQ